MSIPAVDRIAAVVEVAHREGRGSTSMAPPGGFFLLTEHGGMALAGVSQADSIALTRTKAGSCRPVSTPVQSEQKSPAEN